MTDEPTPDFDPADRDGTSGADCEPGPEAYETPSETHLRELLQAGADGTDGDALSAIHLIRNRVHRRRVRRSMLAACTAAVVIAAGVLTVQARSGHSSRPVVAASPSPPAYRLTGALVSFNACSDYLAYVKAQAQAAVGPYGLQPDPGLSYAHFGAAAGTAAGATGNLRQAAAPANAAASSSAAAGTPTFSTTNDQVAGVDEPDSIKTDGKIVVTLAGSTLRLLDLDARVIGSLSLPGDTGGGLLLAGDRAVVLSSSPSTHPGTVGYVPSLYEGATSVNGPSTASQARATVIDLSNPVHPQLLRSYLFDGAEVAARLVDGQVRLVLRSDGPRISFVTPSSTGDNASATVANSRLIAASTLADWLPYWQIESPDGATTAREPLSTCQAVARPQQASGLSTVTVLTLDPSASAPGPGTSVVAAGDTVYATADHVYVAGPTGTTADPYAGATPAGCCAILPPSGASTAIYDFSMTTSGAPVFEGAGKVPGWLIDSYAMDEDAQGDLRVASTSSASGGTTSQVSVLRLTGGQLATIGFVGGLGSGEFIKTVRFIGDLAYVVTFQSFDPLYVVDLADPSRPALVGQLAQPGFSEFLYPISDRLLIGVGVQITDGEPSGLVVATYDVSDPAHPRQVDSSSLVTGYQYVAQGYDPHAFLYWPATELALLAVPADGEYGTTAQSSGIAAYHIGASGQLTRVATLSHGSTSTTRSAVIDGRVWAFSDVGVLTADLTDLATTTWQGY